MSFYQSDPTTYNVYLVDNVNNTVRNAGSIDLIVSHVIDYLRDTFPLFKQSPASSGTQINFSYTYPEDTNVEIQAPVCLVQIRSDDQYKDSMGFVQGESNGLLVYGIRMKPVLEFDIWARNEREKKFIEGILSNQFYIGLIDGELRKRGIQNVEFVRSIPRGYDQTDRVLQFHTHIVGSDELFRQVMEFEFEFDHRLAWATNNPQSTIYAIKEMVVSASGSAGEYSLYQNAERQPFVVYVS